jgi:hypothetical protein
MNVHILVNELTLRNIRQPIGPPLMEKKAPVFVEIVTIGILSFPHQNKRKGKYETKTSSTTLFGA